MLGYLVLTILLLSPQPEPASQDSDQQRMAQAVQQLRDSIGRWETVTEFLNDDGSVAKSVQGTYEFSWVTPDRVVSGKSEIPELKQSAGILFYVNDKKKTIEMVSVGGDGRLWIMIGPAGEETRYSQEYQTTEGPAQLRFTRYNVSKDAFESKMEYTTDGGKTWKPGNHQTFRRAG